MLILVALQRIAESLFAARNTRRLLSEGAVEVASQQYRFFVALHAAWLVAMAAFIPSTRAPNWWLLGAYALLQPLRLWIIASLGPYWTTRLVAVPHAPLVRRGPYRWVRHPNYMLVCAEIALLPLAFGAVWLAIAFSLLNAALLAWRIKAEERTLQSRSSVSS